MSSSYIAAFFIFLQLTQNIGCYAECHCKKPNKDSVSDTVDTALMSGIKTAALAGVAVAATPMLLGVAGFGAAGITAGSIAAGFQSTWFGATISGLSGAVFSTLQSIGAGGLGLVGKTAIISSTGTVVKVYDTITGEDCDC